MDDAFDALLATTIFLTATLYALQAAVAQSQPNPTLNGYEQQLAQQLVADLQTNPNLPQQINGTTLQTQIKPNATTVELPGAKATLQPPAQLAGQVTICAAQPTLECAYAVIGANPQYSSCYTQYAATSTLVRVTVCLG